MVHEDMGEYEKAKDFYERAIEIKKKHLELTMLIFWSNCKRVGACTIYI